MLATHLLEHHRNDLYLWGIAPTKLEQDNNLAEEQKIEKQE